MQIFSYCCSKTWKVDEKVQFLPFSICIREAVYLTYVLEIRQEPHWFTDETKQLHEYIWILNDMKLSSMIHQPLVKRNLIKTIRRRKSKIGALFKSLNVGQVCNWQGILISDEKLQGMVTKLFNIHNLAKKLFFVTCCYLWQHQEFLNYWTRFNVHVNNSLTLK